MILNIQETYRGIIGNSGDQCRQLIINYNTNEAIIDIQNVQKELNDKSQLITFLIDEPMIENAKYWLISFDTEDTPIAIMGSGNSVPVFNCWCESQSGGGGCSKLTKTEKGTTITYCVNNGCIGCCSGYLKDSAFVNFFSNPGSFIVLQTEKIILNGISYQ